MVVDFCLRLYERLLCRFGTKKMATKNSGVQSQACAVPSEYIETEESIGNVPNVDDRALLKESSGISMKKRLPIPMIILENLKVLCLKCNSFIYIDYNVKVSRCNCGGCEVAGSIFQSVVIKGREHMSFIDESSYMILQDTPKMNNDKSQRIDRELN